MSSPHDPHLSGGRTLPAILIGLAAVVVLGLLVAHLSGAFDPRTSSDAPAAPVAPVVAPVVQAPLDRTELEAALQQAIRDNRIVQPLDANAITLYNELTRQYGESADRLTTLLEIFPVAVQAIEGSLDQGALDLAASQIALLESSGHSSSSLQLLRENLNRQLAERTARERALSAQRDIAPTEAASSAGRPTGLAPAAATSATTASGSTSEPSSSAQPAAAATAGTAASATAAARPSGATPSPATLPASAAAPLTASPAAGLPAAQATAQPGPNETQPVQIAFANPTYPARARSRRIEGEVELAFTIDRNGEVRDIEVLRAEPDNIFNTEAIRAAQRWRFEPRRVDGEAVETRSTRVLRFRLGEG